jgi:hypothetical protein
MSNKIVLTREDLDKIQNILSKILGDKEKVLTLTEDRIAGIGSVLTLSFDYNVDGITGKYSTEISGVEAW